MFWLIADALFKLRRKLFCAASPFICNIYNLSPGVRLKDTSMVGFAYIRGNVTTSPGTVLVSLRDGNALGIQQPCRLIATSGSIEIGSHFRASGVCIYSSCSVVIGENVTVGPGVTIIDDDMHPINPDSRRLNLQGAAPKPIKIGNDVWLCKGVTILKGVQIGDRSVVGAGIVVTKAIPPDTIVTHAETAYMLKALTSPQL